MTEQLKYQISLPENVADGAPVIVLLHGRGSDMNDLQGLRRGLPKRAILVTPQAPFSGEQWGYGGGWAWYEFLGGTFPEPKTFSQGLEALSRFVADLPSILPVKPGPVVIGGFSQGGTSSLAFALRNPGTVAGVLMFSGFLASNPSVVVSTETAGGLKIFWGHGSVDQMISFSTGKAGREALLDAGADLVTGDYQIGHWIDDAELADASAWLEKLFGTRSYALMSTRTIDPAELKGDAVRHLLNAAVAPRPIGWISSLAPNGKVNIAPHSYTTIFALNPPVIGFVSSGRKDTLNNVEAIGDFVYHISGVELANELNLTSADFPPEISEVEWTQLTSVPSDLVRTPRILEAPIAFEAKLVQVQEILTSNSFLVLGQVVKIHISEAVLTGDRIDPAKLLPITRLAGNQYSYLGELFSMVRPTYADLNAQATGA